MQEIPRDKYLQKLISHQRVPLIKVITGIRRCGKSYLLDPIFKNYLIGQGVPEDHIIHLNLEFDKNKIYRNPTALREYVEGRIGDSGQYYVLLDEIQLVPEFEGVLSGFLALPNVDVYVTGSNSKFLSSDIITEFRGRSDEIRMYPLSFLEYYTAMGGDRLTAWLDYTRYGGLPLVTTFPDAASKMGYLINLQKNIYLKDVVERYNIKNDVALTSLVQIVASSTGSLTNPYKLENTFKSVTGVALSHNTIGDYLARLGEAYILEQADRYDVKGKQYIDTPHKYYFTDIGLRNSFLGFRQQDDGHVMENIIYNELRQRGYQVDVGVVKTYAADGKETDLEVNFVANRGDRRYYVQSALRMNTAEIQQRELKSLRKIDDSFKKIVITADLTSPVRSDDGIITMNILDFLLTPDSLERDI
ncbi:ATP-binding protein [Candidatus Saccharibacteria bacterium]|nr:ATP-binding protein [Candidatus Saccharibacteria bacterium]